MALILNATNGIYSNHNSKVCIIKDIFGEIERIHNNNNNNSRDAVE